MYEDPIVAEIRHYRKEHSEKYGNDLNKICIALREQQIKSGREVVCLSPRLIYPRTRS